MEDNVGARIAWRNATGTVELRGRVRTAFKWRLCDLRGLEISSGTTPTLWQAINALWDSYKAALAEVVEKPL